MGANVFWITGPWRGRLGIVSRPRGGDWLDEDMRAWREAGIDIVVSFLEPHEEAELLLAGEAATATVSGLKFDLFLFPTVVCRALARRQSSFWTASSMHWMPARELRSTAGRA